jgi:hypothetical protein
MWPNFACHQIFTTKQETLFADYLLQCLDMAVVACRHLCYETVIKSNVDILDTCTEEEVAGLEWFPGLHDTSKTSRQTTGGM